MPQPRGDHDLVWYVSYGSNMLPARLRYYLAGGRPPGGRRTYPGARDASPPVETAALTLPGGVFFALESRTWTGGMAFYDPLLDGPTPAAGHLVTRAQFSDVATQEMHHEPGRDLPFDDAPVNGRITLGPGRYETLLCLGDHAGAPMFTFTCPWRATEVRATRPAGRYLRLIAAGISVTHGWGADRITDHLMRLPGVGGTWHRHEVSALVTSALENAWSDPARPDHRRAARSPVAWRPATESG
ncbi:MAG: histone deacetylase [Actinocatenispora sp.]